MTTGLEGIESTTFLKERELA